MSSKNRNALAYGSTTGQLAIPGVASSNDYGEAEFYPSPAWTVHALLAAIDAGEGPPLPDGLWYEPAVGEGAIVRAAMLAEPWPGPRRWITSDIRPGTLPASLLAENGGPVLGHRVADFLAEPIDPQVVLAMTNPPFSFALPFAERGVEVVRRHANHEAGNLLLLLPLSFFETAERAAFLRANPCGLYPLARRPSFTGGGNDSRAYGWFRWTRGCEGRLFSPLGA